MDSVLRDFMIVGSVVNHVVVNHAVVNPIVTNSVVNEFLILVFLSLLLLFFCLFLMYTIYRLRKKSEEEIAQLNFMLMQELKHAADKQRAVLKGNLIEVLFPVFSGFKAEDIKYLGNPVDYIIFSNFEQQMTKKKKETKENDAEENIEREESLEMENVVIQQINEETAHKETTNQDKTHREAVNQENENKGYILFVEIKTGKSRLSKKQKLIKEAVEQGRVMWKTIVVNDTKELNETEEERNTN